MSLENRHAGAELAERLAELLERLRHAGTPRLAGALAIRAHHLRARVMLGALPGSTWAGVELAELAAELEEILRALELEEILSSLEPAPELEPPASPV